MASKSGQEALSTADIEELLDTVDTTMERLKTLYEQYFLGIQKQAPAYIHSDVERKLRELTQINIRNTGLRYRLATLQQKFGSYNSYWRRTLRQIENGTYVRNLAKIGRDAARTGSNVPDEILAAMPKRMREQVLRDRDQALAIAKRRNQVEDDRAPAADDVAAVDDVAIIQEPAAVRRDPKTRSGAHVLDEDAELDFDQLFSAFQDDAPPADAVITRPVTRMPQPDPETAPTHRVPRIPASAAPTPAPTQPPPTQPPPAHPHASVQPIVQPKGPAIRFATPAVPSRPQTGPVPNIPAPPAAAMPKVPAPAQNSHAAPSQQVRPNPIAPGSAAATGAVHVESMSGPFARPETAARATPPPGATAPRQPTPPPGATAPRQPTPPPGRLTPPPGATAPRQPTPPPGRLTPPPGMTEADVNALHAKYVQAKQMVGEKVDATSREKLLRTINQSAPKIMEQYKASGVDFSVVVKDNQVVIKAKPKT